MVIDTSRYMTIVTAIMLARPNTDENAPVVGTEISPSPIDACTHHPPPPRAAAEEE